MLISTREIISALSQKHTDLQSHQVVFCCLSLVLVGQSLVFNGLVKGGTGLSMSSTGDRMDWLSCRSALEGDGLGYRASGRRRFRVQSLGKETVSGTEPREGDSLGYRAAGRSLPFWNCVSTRRYCRSRSITTAFMCPRMPLRYLGK